MFEPPPIPPLAVLVMIRILASAVLAVASCIAVNAQTARNMAVLLSAKAHELPTPHVVLAWDADQGALVYDVYRKRLIEKDFPSAAIVQLDSLATGWLDSTIVEGEYYEYRVVKQALRRTGYDTANQRDIFLLHMATGYAAAGVKAVTQPRGRALVLVDSTMTAPLADELATLLEDLTYEGWRPSLKTVARATAFDPQKVADVQALIRAEHGDSPLGAIMLIGRVAVPYSGDIAPDGHVPDHLGAWPCDGCYGDIDGIYTDASINRVNTQRPAQNNVPGDGKWDNSLFASDVDVPVGRVDFYNMPAFSSSETELLRAYLTKNHRWRTGSVSTRWSAIIDDNFGTASYPESFASSAWRMFSPFVTDTGVRNGDYFGTLSATPQPYLFSYGTGGGTNSSAGGVGTSKNFADSTANTVFTFLFGSYFGDWDTRDNFMRASIASHPQALTCGWSGRPHWYLHRMAMGGTIGESALLSQNNVTVSPTTGVGAFFPHARRNPNGWQMAVLGDRMVHIALMGDPTLRLVRTSPPSLINLTAQTEVPNKVNLTWERGPQPAEAYMVYRQRGANPNFVLLTPKPITELAYGDSLAFQGRLQYRVVPVTTVVTHAGSVREAGMQHDVSVVVTSVSDERMVETTRIAVSPNPAHDVLNVAINNGHDQELLLTIFDLRGVAVQSTRVGRVAAGSFTYTLQLASLPPGAYTLHATGNQSRAVVPIIVVR